MITDETTPEEPFPSWQNLEDIGAGDGIPTECERCGKPGTPRQQFQHTGVTICYMCADERVDELRSSPRMWCKSASSWLYCSGRG